MRTLDGMSETRQTGGSGQTGPGHEVTISRRYVVGGATTVALGLPLLAACGGSGDAGSGGGSGADAGGSGGGGGGGQGSGPLIATADVPVGGGVIDAQRRLVTTQPTKGTFKVFSAVCTHQGCTVAKVVGRTIDCPCHGSQFSVADGSVVNGPASQPLASVKFSVKDGKIVPQA